MKKELKLKIFFVLVFFILQIFFINQKSYAETEEDEYDAHLKIPITAEILGDFLEGSCTFGYKIEAYDTNPRGADNEPTSLEILMSSNDKISNSKFSKTEYIDLTNVSYRNTGSYLYKITEISSSYPGKYYISPQSYRIEVIVRYEGGEYKPYVLWYVSDLNKDTKEDKVNFEHIEMTYLKFEMSATGRVADPR